MKKIFSLIFMMFACVSIMFAQQVYDQNNYAGSSKFTDNISVKAQAGVVTHFDNMFKNGDNNVALVLGIEKYFTPWLGAELEGRTSIGCGSEFNLHTAFDMVNIGLNGKLNLTNLFAFTGERKMFEPVVFAGLGWGHSTANTGVARNWMTFRTGADFVFNLGKSKALGIVVTPSVVWGDVNKTQLFNKHNGSFELTAGLVYHFKSSNGKRSFAKAKLYDPVEIAGYQARIDELRRIIDETPKTVNVEVIKEVVKEVPMVLNRTHLVTFEKGKANLTNDAKDALDKVNGKVKVVATASPEGTKQFNQKLSELRAKAVADYLINRGIEVVESTGIGVTNNASNRVAVVTVVE